MAGRQQRNAGVPGRGRPARCPAAGSVRTLSGDRSGRQAKCSGHRGARRRARARRLDVLSAASAGERAAERSAGNRPARLRRGSGAAGDRGDSGRSDQAAAGARAGIRGKPHGVGRKHRSALCHGRDARRLRLARRPASPASEHRDDAPRGALGVAGRSRLLGSPHAPSRQEFCTVIRPAIWRCRA